MSKRRLLISIALGLILVCSGFVSGAERKSGKPLPPLTITISPLEQALTPEDINPADIVEFKATAVSFIDADEMDIKIELRDGAELVSGETEWVGLVRKNEEKTLLFSVRAPKEGFGKIIGRVSIEAEGRKSLRAETKYVLGREKKEQKSKPEHPAKKNHRGRDVIEYQ